MVLYIYSLDDKEVVGVLDVLKLTRDSYHNFNMTGSYFSLFFIAVLFIYMNKRKEERELFVYPTLTCLAIIIMPITAKVIERCIGSDVYWRVWWLFPIMVVLSYTGVKIVMNQKNRREQWVVLVSLCVIIMVSGKSIYSSETMKRPDNIFKLPNDVMGISALIKEDSEDEEVRIIISNELVEYIRLYNPRIKLLYGREQLRGNEGSELQNIVYEQMSSLEPDMEILAACAREGECRYIVLLSSVGDINELADRGFDVLGNAGAYTVYLDVTLLQ